MCYTDQAFFWCLGWKQTLIKKNVFEYFLILALEKSEGLSSMERHQYSMFRISFIHSLKVLSMLYILDMCAENVTNKNNFAVF